MNTSERLARWVREQVRVLEPRTQFPSDRELAKRWGLSAVTVRRVLSRLTKEGTVVREKGRGTFVPGGEAAHEGHVDLARHRGAIDSVVAEVSAAIGRGELRRGDPLPPYKVMRANLGVSPNTVSRAYRALQQRGYVFRAGRNYRVGHLLDTVRTPARKEVFFFADEAMDISSIFSTHEAALAFNKMERELAQHGHRLYFDRYGNLPNRVEQWLRKRHFPQGLILTGLNRQAIVNGPDYERLRMPLERLLGKAGRLRPSVLSLATVYRPPNPHIVTFSISHAVTQIARRLARFVLESGVRKAYFFIDEPPGMEYLILDALRMVPEIDHLIHGFHTTYVIRPADGNLSGEHFMQRFASVFPREHLEPRLSKYRSISVNDIAHDFLLTDSFDKVFSRCRSYPAAWIFAQDRHASAALEWCQGMGADVPRDVSIVGLENDRAYADRGISACVRDWETMGYLMAHAIIGDIPLQHTRRGFVAYDALFLERMTTGR